MRRKRYMVEEEVLVLPKPLLLVLRHYAELGAEDREAWRDRLMDLEGAGTRDLSRLHGELIAQGWVEQNTGVTSVVRPGVAASCYRITAQGLKTYRKIKAAELSIELPEEAELSLTTP